jgi:hypothetical protein
LLSLSNTDWFICRVINKLVMVGTPYILYAVAEHPLVS